MKRSAGPALRIVAALSIAAVAACSQPRLLDSTPNPNPVEAPLAQDTPAPPAPPPPPEFPVAAAPAETPLLGAPTSPQPAPYVPAPSPDALPPPTAVIPEPPEPYRAPPRPQPATPAPSRLVQAPTAAAETPPAAAAKPSPPVPVAAAASTQLSRALAGDMATAARLSIPDGLPDGREGIVVLALPANLGARLDAEAAKLGLADEASLVDVTAILSGQGYNIAPASAQSARLGPAPVKFAWQVSETADTTIERTPLRAEITAQLKGGRSVRRVYLASIGAVPAPAAQKDGAAAKTPLLSAENLALTIPLVLILAALFILGRWARSRQQERARRRAALEEFHA